MKTKSMTNKNHIVNIKNEDIFECTKNRILARNNGCSVIIPHVCNNVNAFGAGFAKAVATRYPIVKENYHLLGPTFLRNNLGYSQYVEVLSDKEYGHKLIFVNMIAQNGIISEKNSRPLNYLALTRSMASISKYCESYNSDHTVEIHCPKFGSGLSGGNWLFISDLIDDIWTKIPVFVYSLS